MVILTMPVFNEADGIVEFLTELDRELPGSVRIQLVDDASTDSTTAHVRSLGLASDRLALYVNESNMGHGPTTMRGLRLALETSPSLVIAVDGDGQFEAGEIARLIAEAAGEVDVIEGVRVGRDDPWFRRVTSRATGLLVALRCGRIPADANTPLRVYRPAALEGLIAGIPEDFSVPNLVISARARRRGLRVEEVPVSARVRRGVNETGSSWGSRRRSIPSTRFVRFCGRAIRQWLSVSTR
jgi:glycosyltransferase involved in cell wall biosynthesis